MARRARRAAAIAACALAAGCAGAPSSPDGGTGGTGGGAPRPPGPEAGFVDAPSRDVVLHGAPVHLAARAHLFYNLWPAPDRPEEKPIFIVFNGFASEIVRAFGTGPVTVADGGAVVDNPSPLTEMANLVYVDPRQSGFSYDIVDSGKPTLADCGTAVFNEYVDAADVLFAVLAILDEHPEMRGPVHWVGESYGGVRIQWILAYLRDRWDLAPYEDAALKDAIGRSDRGESLRAGQVLLSPWLVGSAHAAAISDYCAAPEAVAAVSAAVGMPCGAADACSCAQSFSRSRYNFDYSIEHQNEREFEASAAHVQLDKASRLFGVSPATLPDLAAPQRRKGSWCPAPRSPPLWPRPSARIAWTPRRRRASLSRTRTAAAPSKSTRTPPPAT
jgi:hypothetical protein